MSRIVYIIRRSSMQMNQKLKHCWILSSWYSLTLCFTPSLQIFLLVFWHRLVSSCHFAFWFLLRYRLQMQDKTLTDTDSWNRTTGHCRTVHWWTRKAPYPSRNQNVKCLVNAYEVIKACMVCLRCKNYMYLERFRGELLTTRRYTNLCTFNLLTF